MTKVPSVKNLFGDIKSYIERARLQTAQAVNAGLVTLYWQIGKRIRQEILRGKRAEYGEEIVATRVAQYLTQLPSKKLLAQKLHEAVILAKEQNFKVAAILKT